MKNLKKAKIIILFAIILSVTSCLLVTIREVYIKSKIENALAEVEQNKDTITQKNNEVQIETEKNNKKQNQAKNEKETNKTYTNGIIGEIIIPVINVKAPIKEGVTLGIINYTVRTF